MLANQGKTMIEIKGTSNVQQLSRALRELGERQLPFALALAATKTAQDVQTKMLGIVNKVIDRPTPITLKSLYLKPATKVKPTARVYFKDSFNSGIPADKYMQPSVYGGARTPKRFEKALRAKGLIGQNQFAIPTSAIQDQYGNVKGSLAIKVLSGLGAAETTSGVTANASTSRRSRKKGNARKYFIAKIDNENAIWERKGFGAGEGIRPIFMITDHAPKYRVKLPFFEIAGNIVQANYAKFFDQAIDQAIATAKRK